MTTGTTSTQGRALAFIAEHIAKHGYAPSCRELCEHMGAKSSNAGYDWLRALERKGFIRRAAKIGRAIRITAKGEKELTLIAIERRAEESKPPP